MPTAENTEVEPLTPPAVDNERITCPSSTLTQTEESTMRTRSVDATTTIPTAQAPHREMPCGHSVHLGSCPHCQRAQLARWGEQLAEASRKNG
jgi:hypothetical protein